MKLENIIKLRLNNFEIAPNAEALPKEEKETIGKIDLADYPWDKCIADQMERYGDEEIAKRVCGAIKALYAERQEMEISPNPCWEGYEPIGLKEDGSPNCVPIKNAKEKMDVVKEGFPVPSPEGNEDENTFISRCMHEIGNEYDQKQAVAICYAKWKEK